MWFSSFEEEKISLSAENTLRLKARLPRYSSERKVFRALDPLQQYRAAIENEFLPSRRFELLLVTGAGRIRAVADHRAQYLMHKGTSCLLLEIRGNKAEREAAFID